MSNITCAVLDCKSQPSDDSVEFFQFPLSEVNRIKWNQFCGIVGLKNTNDHICSRHFDESAYITEIKQFGALTCLIRSLHPDAVPTLYPSKKNETLIPNYEKDQDLPQLGIENKILNEESTKSSLPQIGATIETSDSVKYGQIKTREDLLKLSIANQILQRRVKLSEAELAAQKRCLKEKEQLLAITQSEMSYKRLLAKTVLSKIFSQRQLKVISNKKTQWTEDDFAVGLTIRHLSNRNFYDYLINTLNYPLPGASSIRRYITLRKRKAIRKTPSQSN